MSLKRKQLKAISIFEVLIYLALFGIVFIAVVQFVIAVRNSNLMAEQRTDLEKTAIYMMNHLNSSFVLANDISSDTNTVYEQDNGRIRLLLTSSYLEYYLENGSLVFNNNGTTHNITNPDFSISRFYLEEILNNDGELKGVRCNIIIVSIKDNTVSKTIQTSFILK